MISQSLRSSSYNCYDWCEHKFYLEYVLNLRGQANKKAVIGNIVHKALELLAQKKLAIQQGEAKFHNTELTTFNTEDIIPSTALTHSFDYYKLNEKSFDFTNEDKVYCTKLLNNVLMWHDGMFNPLKMNILSPEQYFDFEIKKPWAFYSHKLEDGKEISGYLRINGTIDLVTQKKDGIIEVIDWKTGRPNFDWNKGKYKSYLDLCNDPQLRIYHYAAAQLYPKASEIFMTIFYAQEAPHSICFQRSDLEKTEEMLQKRFTAIRNNFKPKRIHPNWKCKKLCHFYKNGPDGPVSEYKDSICSKVHKEIQQLGVDKVLSRRGKDSVYSGGGKTNYER